MSRLSSTVLVASNTGQLAFALGTLGVLAFPRFLVRYKYVPLVLPLAFVMEYQGATISPRLYGHYFLQVMPSFVLCCASGGALIFYLSDRIFANKVRTGGRRVVRHLYRWDPMLLLLIVPSLLDSSAINAFRQRLTQPFVRAEVGTLSAYIKSHAAPSDYPWAGSLYNSRFYIETGLTSPTGNHQFVPDWLTDSWRTTAQKKFAELRTGLIDNRPTWLILDGNASSLRSANLMDWMCVNYTRTPVNDRGYGSSARLYIRSDRAARLLETAALPNDATCTSAYIELGVAYYAVGKFRKSIEASEKALPADPNSVLANNNICAAHLQLEEFDKAIDACDRALAIDPNFSRARNNLTAAQAEVSKKK